MKDHQAKYSSPQPNKNWHKKSATPEGVALNPHQRRRVEETPEEADPAMLR
jgi:hypothetical protein